MRLLVFLLSVAYSGIVNAALLTSEPPYWLANNYTKFEFEGIDKNAKYPRQQQDYLAVMSGWEFAKPLRDENDIFTWWADKHYYGVIRHTMGHLMFGLFRHDLAQYNTADSIRIVVESLNFDDNLIPITETFKYDITWNNTLNIQVYKTLPVEGYFPSWAVPEFNTIVIVLVMMLIVLCFPILSL